MASLLASAVLTPGPEGLDTPHGFLTRLLLIPGLRPLYVVTRRYRDFKQTKAADSYWRMF